MRQPAKWWAIVFLACAGPAAVWAQVPVSVSSRMATAVMPATRTDPAVDMARRLLSRAGHPRRPLAVVDKTRAEILVFDAQGVLAGRSAVLLGRTRGNTSVPGVGQRTQHGQLRDTDLTTPAGLFASEPGRNLQGEAIVWIDYDAALAIHRLRDGPSHSSRSRRLAGNDPLARRVSAGCVVVPEAFFDTIVQPLLGHQRGIVLVMPEQAGLHPL